MGGVLQEPGRTGDRPTSNSRGCRGLNGTGPARKSPPRGSEHGEEKWERGNEYISDPAFDAGSLSALIVLMTSGNAAAGGPDRGKRSTVVTESLLRNTGACFET